MRVAVVHNLRRDGRAGPLEAEYDSPETIAAVCDALRERGDTPLPVEADAGLWCALRRLNPDLVFNMAEGTRGEGREAQVPAMLEMLGLRYTGSRVLATAVCLHKPTCKRLLQAAGLATPAFAVVAPGDAPAAGLRLRPPLRRPLRPPYFVKPASEGSGLGVEEASVCGDPNRLRTQVSYIHARFDEPALIEEFLPGREFTVGILGNEPPRVLPLMEVRCGVYGERIKQQPPDARLFPCPAPVDPDLSAAVAALAVAAFRAVGCADVARVDIRLDRAGRPYVLEINPLPGLAPAWGDLPRQAAVAGLTYAGLISSIVDAALRRWGIASLPTSP